MNLNSKILFGIFISALLLTGCISEYNAVLPENDRNILFVTGDIIENTDVIFRISQSFPLSVDAITNIPKESFIDNASLSIIGSNGYKSPPAINQGNGTYLISVGKLEDNAEYGIRIDFDGNIYQSTPAKPLYTPAIDTVYWIQPEPLGEVSFYLSTHDDTDRAKFFLWNYVEDWEIEAYIPATIFYNPEKNELSGDGSTPYRYCWKKHVSDKYLLGTTESLLENKILDELLYRLKPEGDRFSITEPVTHLYCVTVTQKAGSRGAYEYYQNINKLNKEMGGLFTPQPSELSGNITCITNPSKRIMGYVETVKNVSQKRIFIEPKKAAVSPESPIIWPLLKQEKKYCDDNTFSNDYFKELGWTNYREIYNGGYRPLGGIDPFGRLVISSWAPAACVDCTANGGTKNKPDFWPNDHK